MKRQIATVLLATATLLAPCLASAAGSTGKPQAPLAARQQQLYEQCLRYDEAARDACRLLARARRDDSRLLLELGDRLEQAHRYAEAVAVYEEALETPRNRNVFFRRHAMAASNLRELEARREDRARDEVVAGRLDAIRCARLKPDKALTFCQRALAQQPDNAEIAQRLREITEGLGTVSHPLSAAAVGDGVPLPAGTPSKAAAGSTDTIMAKLDLLIELRRDKLLSEAEYQRRKRSLLDQLQGRGRAERATADGSLSPPARPRTRNHALVVGSNAYRSLPQLETALADATAVADTLREQYGFEVQTLENGTRYQLLSRLSALRNSLTETDNLLIYYAGHGILDEKTNRGYWLPVDAAPDNHANWLSTADVTDALKGMKARHVLVVADSCYAGSLSRRRAGQASPDRAVVRSTPSVSRSRNVLSSGGLEPVLDSGGGKHSVFARTFLQVLGNNTAPLSARNLYLRLRDEVKANAHQTPEYRSIPDAGHENGEFVFVPRAS